MGRKKKDTESQMAVWGTSDSVRPEPQYGHLTAVQDAPEGQTADDWGDLRSTPLLDAALDKAVTIPSSVIHAHVDGLRRRNPHSSPAQIIGILEREYLMVIGTAGGAVGAAAAFPAVGTGVGIALTASDVATFFGSSAAFSLAVADVYGFEVDDAARRRALLMASVLGDKGSQAVEKASGGSALAWGKVLMTSMPSSTLKQVNKALTNKFMRTQLVKHGGLAIGRLVPFGVGAVVGVAGSRALGKTVISQSRRAFGPPPQAFRPVLEVIEVPDGAAPPLLVPAPADRLSLVDAPVPGAGPGVVDEAAERAAARRARGGSGADGAPRGIRSVRWRRPKKSS
ncbi:MULTISPECIES: hypothetical protein [Oerskovia]|uniref:EcsC protein family protein n=1 Tax=Oerskovia enterophila TaxID=43678 RepID=A0ABX2Y252_9CELL|nr:MULTISPECIES: hypothetical protein [Oerskovia]OCI30625.1 hypothetical protein OERS_27010 [Oerskovia enterophila]